MKGLLTKDLCLIMQRKRSFILILLFGIIVSFSTEPSFFVSWLVMIGSVFGISTIGYDEHDNCYPFLMTLPVSRKTYVLEKYLFSFLCGASAWILGIILFLITSRVRALTVSYLEEIISLFILLLLMLMLFDISIPLNLRFGAERGRIYMLIVWGALFGLGFILSGKLSLTDTDSVLMGTASPAVLVLIAFALSAAVTAVSVAWSIRIMEKKDF